MELPPRRKRKIDYTEPEEVSTVSGGKVKVTAEGVFVVTDKRRRKAKAKANKRKKMEEQTTMTTTTTKSNENKKVAQKGQRGNAKTGKKSPQKQSMKKANVSEDGHVLDENAEHEVNVGMLEKNREILEMRRNREIDVDLFSDTTADSELSEAEETTPSVKSVKNTVKSSESAKNVKTKKSVNIGKITKSKGTKRKSKAGK